MRHVILSPHSDDAVLSCGGTMARLVDAGEDVLVITFFCGPAVQPFSPLALALHEEWGFPRDVVRLRRAEDAAALARIGAAVQWEPLPDAIYRRNPERNWDWTYRESVLGKEPDRAELWLVPYLAERVRATVSLEDVIYVPLGIGGHVDHIITCRAGMLLHADGGRDVRFYEDFPYLTNQEAYLRRTGELKGWTAHVAPFDQQALAAKVDAFGYYRSQRAMLSRGMPLPIEELISDWAGRIEGERFWRPAQAQRRQSGIGPSQQ